jgi:pimeloyl-ACP methyl ester carboxylesterase
MGGIYARVFTGMFPAEVAGILLVDPSVEEFMETFARKYPQMARISDENRRAQDEWASQWFSVAQARTSALPAIPITLITATKPQDIVTRKVLPYWLTTHRNWLRSYPHAQHIVTTNSGHEVILSDPLLVIEAARAMVEKVRSEQSKR